MQRSESETLDLARRVEVLSAISGRTAAALSDIEREIGRLQVRAVLSAPGAVELLWIVVDATGVY